MSNVIKVAIALETILGNDEMLRGIADVKVAEAGSEPAAMDYRDWEALEGLDLESWVNNYSLVLCGPGAESVFLALALREMSRANIASENANRDLVTASAATEVVRRQWRLDAEDGVAEGEEETRQAYASAVKAEAEAKKKARGAELGSFYIWRLLVERGIL